MTVIDGDEFERICKILWGDHWKMYAAKRFKKSERQLARIAQSSSGIKRALASELHDIIKEQIGILSRYDLEMSGGVDIPSGL